MQLKHILKKLSLQKIYVDIEDIATSNEAEKPKKSFLEYENPQYSSDIALWINIEKLSKLFMFDHCDLVNVESSVRHHMSITPKPFQFEYCNLKKYV